MLDLKGMMVDGEKVEMIIKKHWITNIILGIYFVGGCIATGILFSFFGIHFFVSMLTIVFWLFFSVILYIEWLNFEIDIFIITNRRIIGVDQISFLNIKQSECSLEQVQEVNSGTKGIFAHLFNYGHISLQTAGSVTTMEMDFAPDVGVCSRKIQNMLHHSKSADATSQSA